MFAPSAIPPSVLTMSPCEMGFRSCEVVGSVRNCHARRKLGINRLPKFKSLGVNIPECALVLVLNVFFKKLTAFELAISTSNTLLGSSPRTQQLSSRLRMS